MLTIGALCLPLRKICFAFNEDMGREAKTPRRVFLGRPPGFFLSATGTSSPAWLHTEENPGEYRHLQG